MIYSPRSRALLYRRHRAFPSKQLSSPCCIARSNLGARSHWSTAHLLQRQRLRGTKNDSGRLQLRRLVLSLSLPNWILDLMHRSEILTESLPLSLSELQIWANGFRRPDIPQATRQVILPFVSALLLLLLTPRSLSGLVC